MKKVDLIFCILVSGLLLAFDVYKAAHASFTHDESWTYLHYVNKSVPDIIAYVEPSANNHILNTLLMKLSEFLFGASELSLRLPNILSHLLYLIFIFKIAKQYSKGPTVLFLILANANPFLLDFFSLARGYGLSIGLMTGGFYYYFRYLENQDQRNYIAALFFTSLGAFANFSILPIFLIFIVLHNLLHGLLLKKKSSLSDLIRINRGSGLIIIVISLLFFQAIREIINHKLIDFGGVEGIWEDTVRSQIYSFAYYASYEFLLTIILKIVIIGGSTIFIYRAVGYLRSQSPMEQTQKFILFSGLVICLLIAFSWMQHFLLGTPFIGGRIAIFTYPIFSICFSFLFEELQLRFPRYRAGIIINLMTLLFLFHTCFSLNTSSYFEWQYEKNTHNALLELSIERSKAQGVVSLGTTWLYSPTVKFYRTIENVNWLREAEKNSLNYFDDYYYVNYDDLINIPKYEARLVHYFPDTRSYLLKNRKRNFFLKGPQNQFVGIYIEKGDVLIADRISASEVFTVVSLGNGAVAIYSSNNQFLSAEIGRNNEITANRHKIAGWETFIMTQLTDSSFAFKACNGKYLSVNESSLHLFASGDSIGRNEKFKIIPL